MHVNKPSPAVYVPARQSEHDAKVDAVEYLPAAHGVHELAPASVPVFVIEPAPHSMHDVAFDAVEYLPASHAMHFVAPADVPLSVIDPVSHDVQNDLPLLD